MQRAWQQLGDVLAANQRVRQFQVSITAGSQVSSAFSCRSTRTATWR